MRNLDPQLFADMAAECLERSGHLTLRVTGASMLPSVRPGSRVKIRRAGLDDVRSGDVVLVRTDAGLRLHRLVDIRPGPLLVTRGDNHRHTDPPESVDRLLGVADRIEFVA